MHSSDGTATQNCGEIDTQNAIIYLEAFRYALKFANNLNLTKYKIGYQIVDTCDSSTVLKRVIKDQCMEQYSNKMVAVVGPSSADAASEMSQVFNVWVINMLSYAVGSPIFDDRVRHERILRTVPSDSYQVLALVDLIKRFNWTYVTTVSSCSNYEQKTLSSFRAAMNANKRCLARSTVLPCERTAATYDYELNHILKDSKVRVVVLFTSKDDTYGLLNSAKRNNIEPGRLVWLGSSSWGNLDLKIRGLEHVSSGALTLIPKGSNNSEDFKRHFFSLNPSNNNYTYFIEYWEAIFNCSTGYTRNKHGRAPCTGKEKLEEGKGWHPFTNVQPVFDAVLAAYRGFYRVLPSCPYLPHLCVLHSILVSRKIIKKLQEKPYQSLPSDRSVTFDSRGGVTGQYEILNFAPNGTDFAYKLVGSWRADSSSTTEGKLFLDDEQIFWGDVASNVAPKSVCSEPCKRSKGEIKIPDKNEALELCCWTCSKCKVNQMIMNETCVSCPERQRPDENRDTCVMLPERTVKYSDKVGAAVVCFSCIGFLGTTITVALFIYFYSSTIVKASGRELSFIMLLGIYLCFVAPLVFLSTPSVIVCGIQRFIAGLSFSVIYAPLFLKTNRIFRIFDSAKSSTAKPSLISPLSQTLISLSIIFTQLLLGIVWIIGDPPTVNVVYPSTRTDYIVFCRSDPYTMILNLFICLVIMLACTWYAFRTRHFPKNYNETKSIMYTLYFSCFAWGVFLPTYLLSDDLESFFRTYTLAIFCDVIGFISLVGFFGPKIHLLSRKSAVNDSAATGTMILSQTDHAFKRTEDVRRVNVEEQMEDSPKPLEDNLSNNSLTNQSMLTAATNLSVQNDNYDS